MRLMIELFTSTARRAAGLGALVAALAWTTPNASAQPAGRAGSTHADGALLRGEALEHFALPSTPSLASLPTYTIALSLDPRTRRFAATLTLRYHNTTGRALATLPLLLPANESDERSGASPSSGRIVVRSVTSSDRAITSAAPSLTRLDIAFQSPLPPDEAVELSIAYDGELGSLPADTNDIIGQALGSIGNFGAPSEGGYGLLAVGDGIVTLSGAYPMVAPYIGGEFRAEASGGIGDSPYANLSNFRVSVLLPETVHAVTNLVDSPMRLPGTPDGARVFGARGEGVRDFVLVAGADLVSESVQLGEVTVRSTFLERDRAAGEHVLEVARVSLETLERAFGPYPYTELDVCEASLAGGAGGVEFSAMVLVAGMFYRAPAESVSPAALMLQGVDGLLAGLEEPRADEHGNPLPRQAPQPRPSVLDGMDAAIRPMLDFTLAHEVAHQYFAGILGTDAVNEPWIDEPLAQYAAGLIIEQLGGAEAAAQARDLNVRMNYALYRLLGGLDAPAARPTGEFDSVLEYAGLVYGKAPFFYQALEAELGRDALLRAIATVVAQYRFEVVSADAFFGTLATASGAPDRVRALHRRWFDEAHGDADLGVDGSGEWLIAQLLPPDVANDAMNLLRQMGIEPAHLARMLGGLGGSAPGDGLGIDPRDALRLLEEITR